MIRLEMRDGKPTLEMINASPAVYLDHWAFRLISQNKETSSQFLKALKNKNGTLAVSWINFLEFSAVSDESQVKAAEDFLERARPNIFFIEVNPWKVIESEDLAIQRQEARSEWGDPGFLLAYFQQHKAGIDQLSFSGLFSAVGKGRPDLSNLGVTFQERIAILRNQSESDTDFGNAVAKFFAPSKFKPATRFLVREAIGTFVKDKSRPVTTRDASDFFHSMVPLSYCDIVLLDGQWAGHARSAVQRCGKYKVPVSVAQILTGNEKAVSELISVLEKHEVAPV